MSAKIVINMEDIRDSLGTLNKIFDAVRIIRPLKKKIISYTEGVICETPNNCFDFWLKGKVCSNCISMRAFNEKDTFFKLGWVNNKIYMVIAVPVYVDREIVILELLKDVTNSMTVESSEGIKNNFLLQTINEIGQLQISDSLTGLFNRRFIDERLPTDILNSSVDLIPFTVIFADIDHFKLVNDNYGHAAGDCVLKEFAELLQKSLVGKDDWVARYGGEEFLIHLRNSNITSGVEFTENFRKLVENNVFDYEGNKIRITSSFGVCSLNKNWNIKIEELMDCLDKNLYKAKSSGRNKIVASKL
jgi:diguanylate cyclase (GGDEF)-like protein